MIEVYKIMIGVEKIHKNAPSLNTRTRAHQMKLRGTRFKTN